MKDKIESLIRNANAEIRLDDTDKGNFINLYKNKDYKTYYHLLLEKVLDTKCYFNDLREELIAFTIAGLKEPDFALPELSTDDEIMTLTELLYKTFLYTDILSIYTNRKV
ncbi:MAG TPA: hypothetical protein VK750_10670 [Cytophagaceae bacterium]|jgi:hypothetical protein|nr:hypothetical protein [Cytophagaceae bacterium]